MLTTYSNGQSSSVFNPLFDRQNEIHISPPDSSLVLCQSLLSTAHISQTSVLYGRCPATFKNIPDQTHLKTRLKYLKMIQIFDSVMLKHQVWNTSPPGLKFDITGAKPLKATNANPFPPRNSTIG